jgi:hypothetical protein
VTVRGKRTGVGGHASNHLEDEGITDLTLADARGQLGYGPDERPGLAPDDPPAVGRGMLSLHLQNASVSDAGADDRQPGHVRVAQVRKQMNAGFLRHPAGAMSQLREFVHGSAEEAGIGHADVPVIVFPSPAGAVHDRPPVTSRALPSRRDGRSVTTWPVVAS